MARTSSLKRWVACTSIIFVLSMYSASEALATDARIIDGQSALACQWPNVGQLQGEWGNCSAVVVHPSIAITAAHCLVREPHTLHFGTSIPNSALSIQVESCVADPNWDVLGPHHGVDLAYCTLRDPLPDLAVTPILFGCELALLDDPTTMYFGAGYGVSNVDDDVEKKRFTYPLTLEIPDETKRHALVYSENGNDFCRGDSGAGIFAHLSPENFQGDDSVRLVGIVSSGPAGCDGPSELSLLQDFVAFVESDTGMDLTPCFADAGFWSPKAGCGQFLRRPDLGAGTWATNCSDQPMATSGLSCSNNADDKAPTVTLISPTDGTELELGDTLIIEGTITDNYAVDSSQLYIAFQPVGNRLSAGPWRWQWTADQEGSIELELEALDVAGNVGRSDIHRIFVHPRTDTTSETSPSDDSTTDTITDTSESTNTDGSDSSNSSGPNTMSIPDDSKRGCACKSGSSPAPLAIGFVFIAWIYGCRRSASKPPTR